MSTSQENGRFALAVIGHVVNMAEETVDEHWGDVESTIVVEPEYAAGLKGLETFSHVLVVFWMHLSEFDASRDLVRRPRGRRDMPEVGIFAQRAKHRPNPLGITAVELVAVEGDRIRVRGLDAVNGTPVLDIKPYFPAYDRIEQVEHPDWILTLMKDYF